MALAWTRRHSLKVDLPPGTNATSVLKEIRDIHGVAGAVSTSSVLTMGFAHRYNPTQLRRGPYRKVRRVLVRHGVITPTARAQALV